jgi:hypothetical protein
MAAAQVLHNGIELTVAQTADLKRCSTRFIRKLIAAGHLPAAQRMNGHNRPIYHIPLASLDAKLQRRYLKGCGAGQDAADKAVALPGMAAAAGAPRPLEQYTLMEREQLEFWTQLLSEWREYRLSRDGISKADADAQFAAYATVARQEAYQAVFGRELEMNRGILYRRWRSLRENDFDGLIDRRGRAQKGRSAIDETTWQIFLSFFLDQRQYPLARCHFYTRRYLHKMLPELEDTLPSAHSFYRRVLRDVPIPLRVLGREGEKAYNDRCAPYIRRVMDDMRSDEWWVADCHTMDVISDAGDGRAHRLYLVAFFDPRSYTFVGCGLYDKPSSQATLATLGKCIRKRKNRPKNLYVDNGREFLTYDVGGPGHRARKKNRDEKLPPPVLERLGIKMVNALPRNAQAKLIERAFRDVKDQISRLFPTFTGGNVTEKPEQLKYNLKKGKRVADRELSETIEILLDGYFNRQPYGGMVVKDRGKPRMQVYEENLDERRVTGEEELNLMLMRSSRPQTINKRGVWLRIGDEQFEFFNEATQNYLFGAKVYYRYDPEDLSSVRIYDAESDRLLTVAPMDEAMRQKYGADREEIETAMRKKAGFKKGMMQMLKNSTLPDGERIEAVELVMTLARENEEAAARRPGKQVKTIVGERVTVSALFDQAVGADMELLDVMLRNAETEHEGGFEDE